MQRLCSANIEKAIEKKHNHNLVEAPNHHLNVSQVKGQDVVEIEVQEVDQEVNHVINEKVKQTNLKVEKKVKVKTVLMNHKHVPDAQQT